MIVLLLIVLSPHIGIFLLSIGTIWSFSVLPDAFTLAHYATVFRESPQYISNTLLYCALAALIDVVLGSAIAYLIMRTKLPTRRTLDLIATASLAVPGLVLGISDFACKYLIPEFGTFFIYVATFVVLLWRPQGLFGRA